MRKTIFKRLMALVMSIVMLATMLPMNVKAESQRIESVYITGVRNTYCAGEHPPFDLKVDPSAPYYIDTKFDGMGFVNGVAWFDYTDGVWLKPESVLKEGHYISETIRIKAKENYHFYYKAEGAETICYLDNGDELGTHCTSPQTEFTSYTVIGNGLYRVHQATQTIEKLTINKNIQKGSVLDKLYFNKVWVEGGSRVESVWTRNADTINGEYTVDYGRYYAVLNLYSDDGYRFNWDTIVNVFGQDRHVQSLSSDGRIITITTPTVEIKCDHEDDNSAWQNDGANGLGHYRICSVCGERYDDEEHSFDNGVENGGETTYSCSKCGYQKTLANNNVPITALTINDSALYAGKTPADVERSLRGSGKLVADITNVRCQLKDPVVWLTDNDEFELGKVYKVELTINAKEGFYFADDCTAVSYSKNTKDTYIATVNLSNEKKTMTATLEYYAVKPGQLEISSPELTPGMRYMDVVEQIDAVSYILGADGGGNSENRNMTISLYEGDAYDAMDKKTTVYHKNTGDQWYRLSDNNEATEELKNGRILADKKYKLELVFGRNGNAANLEVTKENISCDGGNTERSDVFRSDFLGLATAHLFYQTGSAIVNTVSIESISEPAFGVNPAATEYTLGKTYLLKKGTISWNTDKAFTCDTEDEYKTTINVSTVSDDFDLAAEDAISVFCPEGFTTDSITRVDAHNVRIVLTAPGIEHDYGEWKETKAATCDTMGEKNAECKKCKHVKLGFIDMLEHDWGEWTVVKEATETEEGLKERVCKKNPVHKEQEVIPKKEVTYRTVSFDANGGTGTMAAVKVKERREV